MDSKEILATEAGRKLDGVICKEVIGLNVQYPYGEVYPYIMVQVGVWVSVPEYSTDISSAYQIMERGGAWDIKKRFRPHPDDQPGSPGRATYQAYVFLSNYEEWESELINKRLGRSGWCWSLPEAICKAALLAKNKEAEGFDIPSEA